MKRRTYVLVPVLVGFALAMGTTAWGQAQAHLDHVQTSWKDTPGQVGLVTILEEEAKIAAQHAKFAASNTEDFDNVKLHTPHVQHAIDPGVVAQGPGKGYGLIRAAQGVMAHMDFARNSSDASGSTKTHAEHVIRSAKNVVRWGHEIATQSSYIVGGTSEFSAGFYAEEIVKMTGWILNGRDADGDGQISWQEGEGGLAQIKQHLGFIQQ